MLPKVWMGFAVAAIFGSVALQSAGQVTEGKTQTRGPSTDATLFAQSGLKPVDGVTPTVMRLGRAQGAEARCLQVAEVVDPVLACKMQQCEMTFVSRRTLSLKPGQRALLASGCGGAGESDVKASLLWGSASVLVLQRDRQGAGLWKSVRMRDTSAVRLETEGNFGTLSWSSKGFVWKESAD